MITSSVVHIVYVSLMVSHCQAYGATLDEITVRESPSFRNATCMIYTVDHDDNMINPESFPSDSMRSLSRCVILSQLASLTAAHLISKSRSCVMVEKILS